MITKTELKRFLKITGTTNDTLLQECIDKATAELESKCNRKFAYAVFTEYYSNLAGVDAYLNFPISSVTSIKEFNIESDYTFSDIFQGDYTTTNGDGILIINDRVRLLQGYTFNYGVEYEIVYAAGYVSGDDWVTSTAYLIGDYAVTNNRLYKCLIAHTSGTFATDLAALKWELSTSSLLPEDLKKAMVYLASWYYFQSPAGKGFFGMSNENVGSQAAESRTFAYPEKEINDLVERYKILNI